MSASSGVWKPELNTDWGARESSESPELAERGSDRGEVVLGDGEA